MSKRQEEFKKGIDFTAKRDARVQRKTKHARSARQEQLRQRRMNQVCSKIRTAVGLSGSSLQEEIDVESRAGELVPFFINGDLSDPKTKYAWQFFFDILTKEMAHVPLFLAHPELVTRVVNACNTPPSQETSSFKLMAIGMLSALSFFGPASFSVPIEGLGQCATLFDFLVKQDVVAILLKNMTAEMSQEIAGGSLFILDTLIGSSRKAAVAAHEADITGLISALYRGMKGDGVSVFKTIPPTACFSLAATVGKALSDRLSDDTFAGLYEIARLALHNEGDIEIFEVGAEFMQSVTAPLTYRIPEARRLFEDKSALRCMFSVIEKFGADRTTDMAINHALCIANRYLLKHEAINSFGRLMDCGLIQFVREAGKIRSSSTVMHSFACVVDNIALTETIRADDGTVFSCLDACLSNGFIGACLTMAEELPCSHGRTALMTLCNYARMCIKRGKHDQARQVFTPAVVKGMAEFIDCRYQPSVSYSIADCCLTLARAPSGSYGHEIITALMEQGLIAKVTDMFRRHVEEGNTREIARVVEALTGVLCDDGFVPIEKPVPAGPIENQHFNF